MRTLRNIAIFIALAIIVSVVAGLAFFSTGPGEAYIKEWLEEFLSTEIGVPVQIDAFETNLWSRVQIDGFTAGDTSDSGTATSVYIDQLRVEYSLGRLLAGTLVLDAIAIDSIAAMVSVDSAGRFGIPLLDAPADTTAVSSAESESSFRIDSISISRMWVTYVETQIPLSASLNGGTLNAVSTGDNVYEGRLTVDTILSVYDSLALMLDGLAISATMTNETVSITNSELHAEGLLFEFTGDIGIGETQDIAGKLAIGGTPDTILARVETYFDLPQASAGNLHADILVEGKIAEPAIDLHIEIEDASALDVNIPSMSLRARYADGTVRLDTLRIFAMGGAANGHGMIVLDSTGESSLNLQLNNFSISSIWQIIYGESSPYTGSLDGSISFRGSFADIPSLTADAELSARDLEYGNRAVPRLDCKLSHASGITDFSLVHGVDTIDAHIAFAEDSLQGTFDISVPNLTALARLADQPDLSGRVTANGSIQGSYTNPSLSSTVRSTGIQFRCFPVDSLFGQITYADSMVTIEQLFFAGELDSIDGQNPPFGLDSLGGSLSYTGNARGRLDSLSGNVDAVFIAPRYRSYGIDSLSLAAAIDNSVLEISDITATYDNIIAQVSAHFDTLTASGSFTFRMAPLPGYFDRYPDSIKDALDTGTDFGMVSGELSLTSDSTVSLSADGSNFWLGLLPIFTQDTLVSDGTMDFAIQVDGPFMTPNATLDAIIREVAISDYLIDSVAAKARLVSDALVLDSLSAYARNQRLTSSGRVELDTAPDSGFVLRDDAVLAVNIESEGFDLSAIKDIITPDGEFTGTLATSLRISGTTALPHFDGWVNVEKCRFQLQDSASTIDDLGIYASFADTVVTIDSAAGMISNTPIVMSGSIISSDFASALIDLQMGVGRVGRLGRLTIDGTVSESTIDLDVQSDSLNVTVFEPFAPEVDSLSGRLGCHMAINGAITAPEVTGSLRIQSLSFNAPGYMTRLSDGLARIRFDKNRVYFDTATAGLNGGRIALTGEIEHDNGTPIDIGLQLQADHITLIEPDVYSAEIDSVSLRYGKQNENYVLDGDIVLGEVRVTAGLRATSVLPWVQSIETVETELPDLIARSRLNVRIRESDKLWIDNNLAHLRLRAEISVIGTPLRPNFTGMMRVEEGYLLYLDRRFDVKQGSVFFNEPSRFNPDILLRADTKVTVYRRTASESYSVYIKAEGLLDNLQYGFYSEPALDKPDIVALLTLGATRTELAGGSDDGNASGGLTDVLKNRAAALTSNRISGYVSRKAGTLFGFDEFTIQGNLFTFDENWGPQLVASKQLTDRVNLTYSTTVGHLNDQSIRLGYKLTRHFVLQGETDRQGRAGIDIKYGITFK